MFIASVPHTLLKSNTSIQNAFKNKTFSLTTPASRLRHLYQRNRKATSYEKRWIVHLQLCRAPYERFLSPLSVWVWETVNNATSEVMSGISVISDRKGTSGAMHVLAITNKTSQSCFLSSLDVHDKLSRDRCENTTLTVRCSGVFARQTLAGCAAWLHRRLASKM